LDIGDIATGIKKTSNPDEIIITVRTVGAGFNLTLSGTTLGYAG
jgi:hypothetical protein